MYNTIKNVKATPHRACECKANGRALCDVALNYVLKDEHIARLMVSEIIIGINRSKNDEQMLRNFMQAAILVKSQRL